mmetsp:Transcript_31420/g.59047  ORF Transcript_31420/g.59047 Transcript_31420/m.59047 type:complete len:583 (+) Transcript_31420:144-1892(+)
MAASSDLKPSRLRRVRNLSCDVPHDSLHAILISMGFIAVLWIGWKTAVPQDAAPSGSAQFQGTTNPSKLAKQAAKNEVRVAAENATRAMEAKCERQKAWFDNVAEQEYSDSVHRLEPAIARGIGGNTLVISSGEIKFPACFYAYFPHQMKASSKETSKLLAHLLQQPQKVWFFANAMPLLAEVLELRRQGQLKHRKILLYTDRTFQTPRSHDRVTSQTVVASLQASMAVHLDALFVPSPMYIFKYASRAPELGRRMLWVPPWHGASDDDVDPALEMHQEDPAEWEGGEETQPGGAAAESDSDGTHVDAKSEFIRQSPHQYLAGVAQVRLKNSSVVEVPYDIPESDKDSRLVALEKDWEPVREAVKGLNVTLRIAVGGVRTNGLLCKRVPNCEEVYTSAPGWPGLEAFYRNSLAVVVSFSTWAPRSHGRVSIGRGLGQLQAAQAFGKAAIVSETPEFVGLVSNELDSLLVEKENVTMMRRAVRRVIGNPGLVKKLSRHARKRALWCHGSMAAERFLSVVKALSNGHRDWATPWQPIWKVDWRSLFREPSWSIGDTKTYNGQPWVQNPDSVYEEYRAPGLHHSL